MRKTFTLTLPGVRSDAHGQRDNGKSFLLTEMSAFDIERLVVRATLLIANAGAEVGPQIFQGGLAGLVGSGIQALSQLPPEKGQSLLDAVWPCVQFKPPKGNPQPIFKDAELCQIEEASTLPLIYKALWTLHTGFSWPEAPLTSG